MPQEIGPEALKTMSPRLVMLTELETYNADELFYKRCFELRDDQKALKKFIAGYDIKELEGRNLIIPGNLGPNFKNYNGLVLPSQNMKSIKLSEHYLFNTMLNISLNRDVFLNKHNRYTPVFKHSHEFFEIFYVLSGKCTSAIGEDKRIVLNAGNLCFITPNTNHTMEVFDDSIIINILMKKTTFDDIFFDLLTTNDILSHFFIGSLFHPLPIQCMTFDTGKDQDILEQLFSMFREQQVNDVHSNRIMKNHIEIFFLYLLRKYGNKFLIYGQDHAGRHWDIIAYINENFRTVTLSKTAKHFKLSVSYCSRLIKSLTGKNFTVFVRDIRIRYAKSLLCSSSERIYDISYSLGFENQETFIRSFKRSCGTTPQKFRQANQ